MAEIAITNCHVHTFTTAHTPRQYPVRAMALVRAMPWLVGAVRAAARIQPWESAYDLMVRLEGFHRTGQRRSQRDVLLEVMRYYPRETRFVVLPVDLGAAGYGPVAEDLAAQHRELYRLSRDPDLGPRVIPFATVFPGRPGAVDELRRCLDEYGFRGVKIYPRLGHAPDHPELMAQVYPLCAARGLPVTSHCSRGGVTARGWSRARADGVTDPRAHVPVLRAFPELRLCLAHFGGPGEWRSYLTDGFDPTDPGARGRNWVSLIADMIRGGDYPGLYTDISYTMFRFSEYLPLLRLFMGDPALAGRILFGSDFYMTRQEHLSEKAVSIGLRDALGEAGFRQIAETNPRVWLGEGPDAAPGA